jgi:hypothetical protein
MINKKILLVVFTLVLFASCKKDYDCECTNSAGTYVPGDPVEARTKSSANKQCAKLGSSSTTCKAK